MKKLNNLYNLIMEQNKIINIPQKYKNFYIDWDQLLNFDEILSNIKHHAEQRLLERSNYTTEVLFDLIQKGLDCFILNPIYAEYRKNGQRNNFTILSNNYPDIKIKIRIIKKVDKRIGCDFFVYITTVLTKSMTDFRNDVSINIEDNNEDLLNDEGYFVGTIPIYVD